MAEQVVEQFARGWEQPEAHAWDHLLSADVQLHQPLLPDRQGRHALVDEYGRLLELMPDLHGEVRRWWIEDEVIVVDMVLLAHLGHRALRLPVIDRLTPDASGRIVSRRATFDPAPAIHALLAQPRVWPRWWRSGVAPLTGRRRLTDRVYSAGATSRQIVQALAVGRLFLALAAWIGPDRSARLVGLDAADDHQRYLLRVFAGRAAALGLGALTTTGRARRRWQQLGLLVDLSDTLAGLDPRLHTRARTLSLATTATYAVTGLAALVAERNSICDH